MAQTQAAIEFSANFDVENIPPFLRRIAPLIESGFGEEQIDLIVDVATRLAVDQEQALVFPIRHAGQPAVLEARVVMDDIAAPDLYIFAPAALASEIAGAFARFAEELGI
jgi:hypothetical protein